MHGIGEKFQKIAKLNGEARTFVTGNYTEPFLNTGEVIEKATLEGLVGGAASVAEGGKFGSGFAGASVGSLAGSTLKLSKNQIVRSVEVAATGGTTSAIGGGNFANGAATALFSDLYNSRGHQWSDDDPETAKRKFLAASPDDQAQARAAFQIKYDLLVADKDVAWYANALKKGIRWLTTLFGGPEARTVERVGELAIGVREGWREQTYAALAHSYQDWQDGTRDALYGRNRMRYSDYGGIDWTPFDFGSVEQSVDFYYWVTNQWNARPNNCSLHADSCY
jgi:hypothetical protein